MAPIAVGLVPRPREGNAPRGAGRRIFPNGIHAYDLRLRLALEPVERNATPSDRVMARLLELRELVSHSKHGILYLIDQCPAHGDRNIAEQKQRQGSDVFRFDEPAP